MQNEELILRLKDRLNLNPGDVDLMTDLFEVLRVHEAMDPALVRSVNKEIRLQTAALSRSRGDERAYLLHRRSLLLDAPVDFDAFCQYLEIDREPGKRFYLPRRQLIRPLVEGLQSLADDRLDLLTISLAPGVGKTTLAIFYLSWLMGRNPEKPNLASAHSDKLTRSIYDGVSTVVADPEYLWKDVFPLVRGYTTNAKDETIDLGPVKRFKTLTCRSIDGSLTGATRAENLLYSDDLVSGIEEALSKERMDTLWVKYSNDLKSRKKLGCKELHIATRWSVHDPIGRLERQYWNDDRARFIRQPALNEDGESNFDYLGGVGFDTKYFLDMKATLDDISWRCLYQQEPIEREGQLYPDESLRRFYDLPVEKPDVVLGVCDTAEGGGDSTFLPVAYGYGQDWYIPDCVCDAGLPEVTDALCAEILLKHSVKQCQFESNSAGGRTADKVQEKVREKGGATRITKKRTTANKLTKIIVNSSFVKERFLFLDSSRYSSNSPYGRMMALLTGFTVTGKNRHDDVPDGLAQLAEFIQSLKGYEVEVFARPF